MEEYRCVGWPWYMVSDYKQEYFRETAIRVVQATEEENKISRALEQMGHKCSRWSRLE